MSDTLKHFFKKLFWVLLTFVILEALLLSALAVITVVLEVKLDISIDIILESLRQTFTNLPTVIGTYIEQRNPFFIIGTVAVLIYSIVLHRKSFKKSGWDTEIDNAYHGSAHWASETEIFDNTNFKKTNKKQLQSDFIKSLKGSGK